ncbi:MAG TPA: hypothetical protein QF353_04130, partial [Gammaproteobacteria bacterium]|nr:hypothetical protein [Gammaproteobacteria bacterium]
LGDFDNRNDLTEVILPDGFMIEEFLAGGFHTFIKGKGKNGEDKLYACGSNLNGQLCLGNNVNRNQWTEAALPTGFKIEQIIVGEHHNFLKGKDVNGEDKLYASGNNFRGQLGLGDTTDRLEWTEVTIPQGFKLDKVVVGAEHSFLQGLGYGYLDKVYASGRNLEGQFGSGDGNSSNEFTEVFMPNGILLEQVMVGGAHSFLKGKDVGGEDKLYGSGFNRQGQLGLGDEMNRKKWTEVLVPQGFSVKKVMAGKAHTLLKVKDMEGQDKLFTSGANIFELGMNKDRNFTEVPRMAQGFDIEDLIAGHAHGLLKGKDANGKNKLYAFGNNYSGQLGLGDNENRRDWTGVSLDKNDWLKRILRDERNREAQAKVGRSIPCI